MLKDYDRGLVVHNLELLFFIGLFPFSASVVSHGQGSPIPFTIYEYGTSVPWSTVFFTTLHINKKTRIVN